MPKGMVPRVLAVLLTSVSPSAGAAEIQWSVERPFRLFGEMAPEWPSDYVGDRLFTSARARSESSARFPAQEFYSSERVSRGYLKGYSIVDGWTISVSVTGVGPTDTCVISIDGVSRSGCTVEAYLRARSYPEGRPSASARLTAVVTAGNPDQESRLTPQFVESTANVEDLLIVSLGDSFASGEGNPDVPIGVYVKGSSPLVAQDPRFAYAHQYGAWLDRDCHRSMLSWPPLVSQALVDINRHRSVTLLDYACTGSKTGASQADEARGPSQLERVSAALCSSDMALSAFDQTGDKFVTRPNATQCEQLARKPDAVLMSIGGNDISFASVVIAAATGSLAPSASGGLHWRNPISGASGDTEADLMKLRMSLEVLLDEAIRAFNIEARQIIITGYPDPTHQSRIKFCGDSFSRRLASPNFHYLPAQGVLGALSPLPLVTEATTKQAYFGAVVPLNTLLEDAARSRGVTFVPMYRESATEPGAQDVEYTTPGYCVEPDIASGGRFLNASDSFDLQDDLEGTMHPNKMGHADYVKRVLPYLESLAR